MSYIRNTLRLAGFFFLFFTTASAQAFTDADVRTMSGAYLSAFYNVNGTNGYFKDTQTGGVAYFWGQAEMIETVIDAYEWNSNTIYQGVITNLLNGFLANNGSSWGGNMYNDDIMWAVIAFARGGADTGKTNYCAIAKANFDMCYARAWDNVLGGGLYWTTDNNTKNACVNGPGSIAASLLYRIYGDPAYLTKATNIYQWERSVLFNTNSGAIYDAIATNGSISTWSSTYNQGTFIGAANFLGQTNDATLAANYTMMQLTTRGILPEYGIAGNNSGFNAIYLRWMKRFMRDQTLEAVYNPWLRLNALAAWNNRRASDNLSWCQWNQSTPLGTNFYAWDCISSFSALQAAIPTQGSDLYAVPKYPAGYWPLNATSGTIASNAAWSGNDGVVNGATWNANGRVGGCLAFNGVNNNVQITNPVANDFTIAFWVKTTQTAGTPQWYNGTGLVDGDAPFTANDFGTALVGGKFGFGVGNPDVTIVSTKSINDGLWHHCAATREEATGRMSIYVDGTLQTSATASRNTLNAPANLLFGSIASGNGFFNGSLDDIRIFSRALSGNEVAALYYSMVTAPSAGSTNVTAMGAAGQVQLAWSDAPLATSYNVKRSLVDGGPYNTITNLNATTFTDTTVLSNRSYYYVVSPVNAQGEGTNSAQAIAAPSSLVAWLKADALLGLTNGSAISAWTDSTSNGYDAIQNLAANQPTYITNAINGLPAAHFNSASKSYLWFYRPVQDDFTLILVFRSTQGIGTGVNFWEGAGLINGEQSGPVNDFGMSLNANGQILAGVGNPDTSVHSSMFYNNGQPHVITFKRTRSSGVIVLYVDSSLVAVATGGTQSLTAPNFLTLGAQAVLNNFFNGDIAEVQIYNSPLSDSDRSGLERALKCKYGIAGGTTPAAPSGLSGAAGNRKISLNWMLSPGANDYTLWRSTDSGVSYLPIASGLTTSSYVDTTVSNGQTNFYSVSANSACGGGANSASVAVFAALPSLSSLANSGQLTLAWPGWANDWTLLSTTNLFPANWIPVPAAPASNSGQFTVTIPLGSGSQYFRLASP